MTRDTTRRPRLGRDGTVGGSVERIYDKRVVDRTRVPGDIY